MNTMTDKNRILSLLDSAYATRINDLTLSIQFAQQALSLSRGLEDAQLIGKSLSHLSLFYMIMGQYERATQVAKEALLYFKELNDEKGIADIKYNLAGVYYKTDNFHLGLIYLIDCLAIYRKFNDHHNEARAQKSLGTIYEYIGDQKNAIAAYEGSIEAAQQIGDDSLAANAYNPLSGIYLKGGHVDKALETIEKAITIKEHVGDIRGLAFSLYGRAKVSMYLGKYAEAETDFQKALDIHIKVHEPLGLGMTYRKMGLLYMKTKQIDKAKEFFQKAISVGDQYNIAIIKFKSNYHLYELYKAENDPVKSLLYLEKYLEQKEAVINTQTLQVIENYELITKMDSLAKEAQLQKEKAEIIAKKEIAEQEAKVRQEFLSTMSHEIRTPLNAVITIISLLKGLPDSEEQQFLNSLKFSAHNLMRIINDILDFTKLDSGMAELEIRSCHFSLLIQNLKNTYEGMAREKGLELLLNIDPEVSDAYELDETKLLQILGNLISNAIKYTDKGGAILRIEKLGAQGDNDILRFEVIDTGVGIESQYLDKLFDSFFQPQSVTTRTQGGSGLGLAIVKKLVLLHGSDINVQSVVGKGSVFFFDLELKRTLYKDTKEITPLDLLNDKTVLLAEDNLINAMVAIKLLSKWGIHTEHAKNGLEAVEISKHKPFDFILMDLHMPQMNGFDATKLIRENNNPNKKSPIFALTADITADQMQEYQSYFTGFLTKPIDIDKMYTALLNIAP